MYVKPLTVMSSSSDVSGIFHLEMLIINDNVLAILNILGELYFLRIFFPIVK